MDLRGQVENLARLVALRLHTLKSNPQPQVSSSSCSIMWSGFSACSRVRPLCPFAPPGLRFPFFFPLQADWNYAAQRKGLAAVSAIFCKAQTLLSNSINLT